MALNWKSRISPPSPQPQGRSCQQAAESQQVRHTWWADNGGRMRRSSLACAWNHCPFWVLGLGASTQRELHESDRPLSHHLSVIHLLTPSHLHTPPSPTAATPSWSFFLSLPPPSRSPPPTLTLPPQCPSFPASPRYVVCAYTRSSLLCGLCSGCREWGYSLVAMHGLLIVVASLVTDHSL